MALYVAAVGFDIDLEACAAVYRLIDGPLAGTLADDPLAPGFLVLDGPGQHAWPDVAPVPFGRPRSLQGAIGRAMRLAEVARTMDLDDDE
jgi:hypothetical protein